MKPRRRSIANDRKQPIDLPGRQEHDGIRRMIHNCQHWQRGTHIHLGARNRQILARADTVWALAAIVVVIDGRMRIVVMLGGNALCFCGRRMRMVPAAPQEHVHAECQQR